MPEPINVLSLFCSAGIADLALRECGWRTLVANELHKDRAALFAANHPEAEVIAGDIYEQRGAIEAALDLRLAGAQLDAIFATPPCQGMSKNGMGKLLSGRAVGDRVHLDPRNQLVCAVVELTEKYLPSMLLMENVPEMQRTVIETETGLEMIADFMRRRLDPHGYVGSMRVVEFADFGVPQRRKRLITIFTRLPALKSLVQKEAWLPQTTHASEASLLKRPWRTVEDAIGDLPPLDAQSAATAASAYHPLHRVPVLDAEKYFWVSNTPPGATAFDNQCANPRCHDVENPRHGAKRCDEGINRAVKDTPIHCISCGGLLPRPWTKTSEGYRIMSGFTSAYKRMRGDLPASAVTRNLSYACSDQKLHPTQNRVLSLHEAEIIHSISQFDWVWERSDRKRVSDKLIRDVIGESIPPAGLLPIIQHLTAIIRPQEVMAA